MAKRFLAAMAGIAFLMTLAYYSGSLRSERAMEQEKERLLAQIKSLELLTKEQELYDFLENYSRDRKSVV